jgi:hypothetical protein
MSAVDVAIEIPVTAILSQSYFSAAAQSQI